MGEKKFTINKLSGIYEIKNKINGKVYIGHSKNISLRWYLHIDQLMCKTHPNHKFQSDFDLYGLSNFCFSILEILKDKSKLVEKEQEYLNLLDFDENYNLVNSRGVENLDSDNDGFIDYINRRWLIPEGVADVSKYRIYTSSHRKEIKDMSVKYNILKTYPSKITFNKIIVFMQNTLGYEIESNRMTIENKQHTYKLVVDFDEEKVDKSISN